MFPWIILFLTVPISQGLITSIGPSPGENVTINCTLSVLPDEIGLISIRWMWTPADEFAEIKILVHYGRSVIQTYDNTRFSNRLIVVDGNTDDGNVSLLLTNITSLDSGIFTCVDKSDSPYRVISQTKLSVRLPERRETEACHTAHRRILPQSTEKTLCWRQRHGHIQPGLEHHYDDPAVLRRFRLSRFCTQFAFLTRCWRECGSQRLLHTVVGCSNRRCTLSTPRTWVFPQTGMLHRCGQDSTFIAVPGGRRGGCNPNYRGTCHGLSYVPSARHELTWGGIVRLDVDKDHGVRPGEDE
uniref:butyrophilin subfamily 2 member A2-like isoform X1 n=1 Tax=Myxine glutinosa TaxID=7769 RepID=UPI00358FD29A